MGQDGPSSHLIFLLINILSQLALHCLMWSKQFPLLRKRQGYAFGYVSGPDPLSLVSQSPMHYWKATWPMSGKQAPANAEKQRCVVFNNRLKQIGYLTLMWVCTAQCMSQAQPVRWVFGARSETSVPPTMQTYPLPFPWITLLRLRIQLLVLQSQSWRALHAFLGSHLLQFICISLKPENMKYVGKLPVYGKLSQGISNI